MTRDLRRRLKRKGLDARAIKVYAHLHSHCFNGPHCWPSQELIGQRCGLSRQLTNHVCQQLRDAGVLTWEKQHKRGSKYPVNVYTLRYWSRPKIAGTVRVLRRLNQCSKALPDTKGQQSRALSPVEHERHRDQPPGQSHPLLTADVRRTTNAGHVTRSCGRERKNDFRRTCMEAQPVRRLQAVSNPSLEAESLIAELERKDQIIRTLQLELNKAMEGEAEWREAAKAAGRATIAAKAQRTKRAKEAATAEQVTAVIDCWIEHRPKTNRDVSFPEGGKRWEMIEKALSLVAEDPVGPVKALREAVEGMHLCPYLVYGKRAAMGQPKDLRIRPEDCFRDEVYLDRARSAYRWAKALPQERCWALYEISSSWSESWFRLTMDALAEPPAEDGFEVDGIVVRP